MLITKDMGIMEIVQKYPATVEVLQRFGMGCIGCAAAHFENIEQGALAHGIDVPALMEALNTRISLWKTKSSGNYLNINLIMQYYSKSKHLCA